MKRQIRILLRKAGLREEEVKLYLTLLTCTSATIAELQMKSGLTHMTTYRTLQRLIDRGLIQATPINGKQSIYSPLSLRELIHALEKEQRRLRKIEASLRDLDHLLPFLEQDGDEESADFESVEIREGAEAFHQEYLKLPDLGNEEFLAVGSSEKFWEASRASIDSPLERSFVHKRLQNNVYSRILMLACNDADEIARNDSREKRTTMQKKELPVMKDVLMICGSQVSHFLCDPQNPRVIIMRDPALVEMQKKGFEAIWKS